MNIPNALTVMRILLIPVFYILYQKGLYAAAMGVFVLASLTDYLDGHLARKWNQITSFGKLADPAADKIMVLTALYCLTSSGHIAWWAVIVVLAKESLMVLGALALLGKKVVVQANIWGKLATVVFIAALITSFPWHGVEVIYSIGHVLVYIAVILSVWAMIQYAYGIVKNLRNN